MRSPLIACQNSNRVGSECDSAQAATGDTRTIGEGSGRNVVADCGVSNRREGPQSCNRKRSCETSEGFVSGISRGITFQIHRSGAVGATSSDYILLEATSAHEAFSSAGADIVKTTHCARTLVGSFFLPSAISLLYAHALYSMLWIPQGVLSCPSGAHPNRFSTSTYTHGVIATAIADLICLFRSRTIS